MVGGVRCVKRTVAIPPVVPDTADTTDDSPDYFVQIYVANDVLKIMTGPDWEQGNHEIRGESHRKLARAGLLMLWDALQLSSSGAGIRLPDDPDPCTFKLYQQIYHYVGRLLLGADCPEKEQLTQ